MVTAPDIAERVRMGRNELGLTQNELARKTGVSRPTIVRIERGEANSVSFGTLQRVLNATNWDFRLDRGVAVPASSSTFDVDAYLDTLFGENR
ncbi:MULTISPECIES: helix-turn-helix domain-containing protein [unclassified Adlercreutzia]|uniref:helix-turn-helix domain-containing protein n=1 Tax=unclassified Adlercreutzia TaxID=2636013 RepID=UPI0013EC9F4F|nr:MULTISPECIES: helix-turn-helix transcriptional regulator [unclassified Adlercreutzia]